MLKVSIVLRSKNIKMDTTSEFILTEAEKLFMKFGMRSVTMDDIAKHLAMSKKTIYANFKDKDDLVISLISKMQQEDECKMKQASKNSTNAVEEVFFMMDCVKDILANINPIVFYDLEKYHNKAYKMLMDFHHTHIFETIKICLERGIEENVFREDINTEILAGARVAQINWIFESDLVRSGKYSMFDLVSQTTIHFLYGICTLSGHILINNYTNKQKQTIQ
jgi:AcrR family transcriptional regulator